MHAVTSKAGKQVMLAALATVALGAPAYGAGLEGLAGVKANGYVEAQYNYNLNSPPSGVNVGRVFDFNDNSFTGNMAELALTKSTDKGPGFGLVLNYGEDARFLDSTTGSPIFVQQAYVMDRVLGDTVDLKFGKLATLAGAEVIEGPANYNISRSFLFGLAIPFTHTGLRAGIGTGMKSVSLTLGLNNGWDNDTDDSSGKTLEAQVGLTPTDTVAVTLNGYYGDEPTGFGNDDKRGLLDLVATLKPMDGLALVFNYDRGSQMSASGPFTGTALWHGYALYANLAVGEKHAVSARFEYFDDHDGFKTGLGPVSARELTLTYACKMKENLEWRAELRHDEANADVFQEDDGTPTDSQNTIAVAAYYSF